MIRIAFRFDDPSPVSKKHVEEMVFDALYSRKIPLTCATVPVRPRGGNEIRFTRERISHYEIMHHAGLMEIALHGYSHCDARTMPTGNPSEFAGIPYQQQKSVIAMGRSILEDVFQKPITGFVPPWNNYDATTVEALEELGFKYLSAGYRIPPKSSTILRNIPLTSRLSSIDTTIAQARRFEMFSPVVVVVLHHYDFDRDPDDPPVKAFDRHELSRILDNLKGTQGVELTTLGKLAEDMSPSSCRTWNHYLLAQSFLPASIRSHLPNTFIPTRKLPSWKI